jgi:glycosyltransferase involved in cell wall biosynthesis
MKTKPFFTIIIPTYNRADFLKIALGSVLSQTFRDWELIIIDDGSTDSTKAFVETCTRSQVTSHKSQERIKYVYQENKGPAAARNRGLRAAQGEYICFLDSDDRFFRNKLQITADYIQRNSEYKIFHSEEIWYRRGKILPQKGYHKKPAGHVFGQALRLCSISISTAAIQKNLFTEIGDFDEKLPACEDYDFWLRATAKYPVFLIPEHLTIKEGGHPDQQSKKYPALDKFRIYAIEKILKSGGLDRDDFRLACEVLQDKCLVYKRGARKRGKLKEVEHCRRILQKFKP